MNLSPAEKPAYGIDKLIGLCLEAPSGVIVHRDAVESASEAFGLHGQEAIKAFVAGGGIEEPVHLYTVPWANNPNRSVVILVDSYEFRTGKKYGYVAFHKTLVGDKMLVKSFKLSHKSKIGDVSRDPRMLETLRAIGISPRSLRQQRGT